MAGIFCICIIILLTVFLLPWDTEWYKDKNNEYHLRTVLKIRNERK